MTNADTVAAFTQIQNSMGLYSDMYDAGYNFYRMLDWSDVDQSTHILKLMVASMFGTFIVTYFVPLNILLLIASMISKHNLIIVLGVLLTNTAIFKAASSTFTPVIVERFY
jgi:hypothetical protein